MLYNVNSYNVDVAKKLGVFSSIYISFIDKLLIRNEKLMLSRTQIYDYTGISESKQEEAERELVSCGVMEINGPRTNSNKRSYNINYDRLNAVISGEEDIDCAYVFLTDPPKKEKNVSSQEQQMKDEIKAEDIRKFRRDSRIYAIFLVGMMVLPMPLLRYLKEWGIAIWLLWAGIALWWAWRIERYKKFHDVHTYKEIVAFMDGKRHTGNSIQRYP